MSLSLKEVEYIARLARLDLTDEQKDWLRLTLIPGVGTANFIRLIARFRTPAEVLRASRGQLRDVIGPKLATRIAQYGEVAPLAVPQKVGRDAAQHEIIWRQEF